MNIDFHALGQQTSDEQSTERRGRGRTPAAIPGRIIWRDSRGTPRFSSVITRDVSEHGAFVECLSGPPIPMHRLVYLQLDRTPGADPLPAILKQGKVLSAVSRVAPVSRDTGLPTGYALRLLIEPTAQTASIPATFEDRSLALPA